MAKLVECIPNFSVSRERDPAVFQALEDLANSIPGCAVLDVQSDGDHNRCVFTMVGSPGGHGGGGPPAGEAGRGDHRHDKAHRPASPDGGRWT